MINIIKKVFSSKPKNFTVTECRQYMDVSYGLKIPSTMYTAVDTNSGEFVCRYIYGAKISAAELKIALDNGKRPGKGYS
jgi:hypothetical protein